MWRASSIVRHRLQAGLLSAVLLLVASIPSGAQDTEVCKLTGTALQAKLNEGAAEIAAAYAKTPSKGELSLNGKPSGGNPVESACNWTCGKARVITPMAKAFGFLQYNCNTTTAPPSTRLPTGNQPETDSEMGLSVTDTDYRAATDKIFRSGSTGVGDLMRVPPSLELASRSADVKTLTDAVEKIPGATWMTFSSTSVINPPAGAARVIIRVVDSQDPPRFEQWIQIAINEKTGKLDRNVDFLAVQLRSHPASPLKDKDPPVVAFRGLSRTPGGFALEGKGSNPPSDLSKCYSCHPTGLRAIYPAPAGTRAAKGFVAIKPEGTIPLKGSGNITELTEEMPRGLARFGPTGYTASENGPPFGPKVRSNRDQFVAKGLPARPGRAAVPGCAAKLPETRRQAIVGNMDCQSCHDDNTERRILNAGTAMETIYHKVVEETVAPMPPKRVWDAEPSLKLDASEREVLFQCLKVEYAELLQEWLNSDLLMIP